VKCKAEALSATNVDITESMVTWCINELQHKTKKFHETGMIMVYNGDVIKSDTIVPLSLRNALKVAAALLENIPEMYHDWHPGSDDTVLDLVRPLLFPVIYRRTRILSDSGVGLDDCMKRCGDGVTLEVLSNQGGPYSHKYQWLPCDISLEAGRAKYIFLVHWAQNEEIQALYAE
jgi:hypothetical protein